MADHADDPLPSFEGGCAQYYARYHWDQDTATCCCYGCHRHCEAASSSHEFLPAQARPFIRECVGCGRYFCGHCTGMVDIGSELDAMCEVRDTEILVCIACWSSGKLKCNCCLASKDFDMMNICHICDELVCNICVCPYRVENDPVYALCAGCLRSAEEDAVGRFAWIGLARRAP